MNTPKIASQENLQEVRYSKSYALITIFLSLVFLTMAILKTGSAKTESFRTVEILYIFFYGVVGLVILYAGITLRSRRYLRLDKENKTLMVFGIIGPWSRKYPFDFMYYAGEKFYIERKGEKRKVYIMRSTCDRIDLKSFIKQVHSLNQK